jgi:SpoVK/Ycf46/Vps4 family AAA+-type ATPase
MPQQDLETAIGHYPAWARALARKYFTKTLNQFILHGNVRDLVPTRAAGGEPDYVPLRRFLADDLFAGRDVVLFYDRSDGIHFADQASRTDFARAVSGYDTLFGTDYQKKLPKDPVRVFALLDNYVRLRLGEGKRVAVVVDYAETVVPMAEASQYSAEDRGALVTLQKWSHDPFLLESDFTCILLTENLTDLNRQLIQSPYNAEFDLAHPDAAARAAYIGWFLDRDGRRAVFEKHSDVPPAVLAQNTAGLGYAHLRTILADVVENRARLTFEHLSEKKKELIEAEAYGLLEFVETAYTLDMVAGHAEAKAHLRAAAEAIKQGRPDVMPMGYLISGPVGTGKTFLINTFAGEIGVPMVKLKNFRSQWQGVTEGNLEKILTLLRAMNPVAVMIDEADAALGDRENQGDSGVSNRVFSQIAQAMSDTRYRGRIIWFLVTARPDLMPVDLKRQGRAEEHLALFYPTTREEREELLRVMMKKTGVHAPMAAVPDALLDGARTFSGADMEAILTRAKFRAATGLEPPPTGAPPQGDGAAEPVSVAEAAAASEGAAPRPSAEPPAPPAPTADAPGAVTAEALQAAVDDFIPPSYPLEVELQTLAAVMECTSRSMLPAKYRDLDREAVVRRIGELKRLIGER